MRFDSRVDKLRDDFGRATNPIDQIFGERLGGVVKRHSKSMRSGLDPSGHFADESDETFWKRYMDHDRVKQRVRSNPDLYSAWYKKEYLPFWRKLRREAREARLNNE